MTEQQPQEAALTARPFPPSRRGVDWMFGGVYGTVLASGLLAALHQKGGNFTPYYDASWVLVTAATAGLAHGYAHHMASHEQGPAGHRWRLLAAALWNEWPLIVAALPTVLLLVASGVFGWDPYAVTAVGLGLNTALLFAWGSVVALRVGHRPGSALLIGVADAAIGLAIIVANALIK
ncbi:hypothetical protein [Streptomyces sp. NRRL F-2664]|uniref:hypothetical protein n=1 Tax=Streptomyces sp. NRRL F-2664 TaxID=1463842 RepID=UPI000AF24E05|nr:hypothetical protein [Streptomyces sp. NRRL F-2664]